jgi:hypothetical protein
MNPDDRWTELSTPGLIDAIDQIHQNLTTRQVRDSLINKAGDYPPFIRDRITALYFEAATTLAVLAEAISLADRKTEGTRNARKSPVMA